MPVFGLPTLDVFKRRIYVFGFDRVPQQTLAQSASPDICAWEHLTLTRLNPPMGFTSRDWSEEIGSDDPTPITLSKPHEVVLKEELRLRGPIPIPVSADGGKTLDWSRSGGSKSVTHASNYLNPIIHYEKKLAAIRLGAKPTVRETASKLAEDLQRRYDLLFLHMETPKPLRLTAAVRWGASNSKIPAHAWKLPVPTQVIEDHLADASNDRPASSVLENDWVQVVNKFISRCDHLDKAAEPDPGHFSLNDRRQRVRSRASSRASSISEGHVSPEDDGPSKKVPHWDD